MAFNGGFNPTPNFNLHPQSVINNEGTDDMAVKVLEHMISEKCGFVLNETSNLVSSLSLKMSQEMSLLKGSLQSFGMEISSAVNLMISHTNKTLEKVTAEINSLKTEKESQGESVPDMLTEISSTQENLSSYLLLLRQELNHSQQEILQKVAAEMKKLDIEPVSSTSGNLKKTAPLVRTSHQEVKCKNQSSDRPSIGDDDPDNAIFATVDGLEDARMSDLETDVFGDDFDLASKKKNGTLLSDMDEDGNAEAQLPKPKSRGRKQGSKNKTRSKESLESEIAELRKKIGQQSAPQQRKK